MRSLLKRSELVKTCMAWHLSNPDSLSALLRAHAHSPQDLLSVTHNELFAWDEFSLFPSYQKSTHQKILDSFFFGESFGSESRTLLRRVFVVNQLEKSVESKEADIVNSLNPLGFISPELSIYEMI